MLDHVGLLEPSRRYRTAIDTVLRDPATRTRDLGGTADTEGFTAAVIAALGQ